jgi:hypothetical protein
LPAEENDLAEQETQDEEHDGGPSNQEEAQDNNEDANAAVVKHAKCGGSNTEVGSHMVEPVVGKVCLSLMV